MAPSRTVIAHYVLNGQKSSKAHTTLTAPLVLHHTRIYKCAMKKFGFNGQMQNEPFLIVIYHSSLLKGPMNAARVCKLRYGVKKKMRRSVDRLIYDCKLQDERKTLFPNAQ
jgi:hypothetical protein